MPSVGTPSSEMRVSARGSSSGYTDAGPPLKISACGLRARICSTVTSWPTSSEYTRHSRTRRAINCAYCPPRSKTSTGRSSGARSGKGRTSAPVIRSFLRDRHVVRMRFAQARGGDAHELRLLHVLDRRGSAVAHRLPQASDKLMQDRRDCALVSHASLDPLGNELRHVLDVALEVPVTRRTACAHRPERTHASVLLEAFALMQYDFAGTLVRSGEQRAGHDRVRAGRNRFGDVAGGGHPAVGDQRNILA